jgi:hypothetical protein
MKKRIVTKNYSLLVSQITTYEYWHREDGNEIITIHLKDGRVISASYRLKEDAELFSALLKWHNGNYERAK